MVAVLTIAYGTDRQHHLHFRILLTQHVHSLTEIVRTGLNGELFFLEQGCRTFLTVIHDLTCLLEPVDMVRTQGEEDHARPTLPARLR